MLTHCGISFLGDLSVSSTTALAREADELGVNSIWMSETHFERDAWTAMASIAANTRQAKIGTGVVAVFPRHPAMLAMSFATLDELSDGRVIAGIGMGVSDIMSGQLNMDYSSPLNAMREAITILKGMLSGETVNLEGKVFTARNVHLAGLPLSREIPLHIAAMGPKMCSLAGELVDGVHFLARTPKMIEDANQHVDEGVHRSGRAGTDVERVAWIIAAVHEDPERARDLAKEHIALVLATALGEYQLEQDNFDPAVAARIRSALTVGGLAAGVKLVSSEMVQKFAAAGRAADVIDKVESLVDAGVTHPVLTAYGPFAGNVLPVAALLSARATG